MRMMTATLVATAALPSMAVAQQPQPPVLTDGTLLDVVAEGRSVRTPDLATIDAGVVTQGAGAAEALSANAARMDRVLAALKRAGVADRDVRTATISLQPQYRYGENVPPVITGYQASNRVTVRFREVAQSGAILDALVKEGANQIDGPTLGLANADAALDEARMDAIARARARAELYAKAAGLRVERIVSIGEGGAADVKPMPVAMMARMDAAPATKIAAGEQDVTATVNVRFLLK
ncbi:SIMPL domain-containing protein [Sphingomonas spermidinifaciens]